MAFLVGGANSAAAADTGLTNSLRFNDDDGAYLQRTAGANTGEDNATLSFWFKLGNIKSDNNGGHIMTEGGTTGYTIMQIYAQKIYIGSSAFGTMFPNLIRDPSAWYHLFVAFDSSQATDTNRVKAYLNGVLLTDAVTFTDYPDQNENLDLCVDGNTTRVGSRGNSGAEAFDGYLAEFHFLDGTTKAYTDFGEFDEDSGIWKPKEYTDGSYGNNGFFLEFKETGTNQDSSGMGADTSGNNNHFAVTSLAATDQCTDTPANNFCTINPVYKDTGNNTIVADYSEGNTKMLTTVDAWKFGRGTFLLTSGKWYAEVKATETGNGEGGNFGIVPSQGGVHLGYTDDNDVFEGSRITLSGSSTDLEKVDTGSATTIFDDFASGSTAHLAIDLDNNKLWVGHSGTWYNDDNASATLDASNEDIGLPSVTEGWVFMIGQSRNGSDNITWEYNWGNPPNAISSGNADANGYGNFEFEVPSGFYAVCTKNLAEYG